MAIFKENFDEANKKKTIITHKQNKPSKYTILWL